MLNNSNKNRIYINLSNISTGGAIQVAMSFMDHIIFLEKNHNFYFFFSKRLHNEIKNSHLGPYLDQLTYQIISKHRLFFYFTIIQPKKIFTLFGPLYSLKLLSGRDWISGFAQPWILFPKNKVYNELDLVTRLRFKIILLLS